MSVRDYSPDKFYNQQSKASDPMFCDGSCQHRIELTYKEPEMVTPCFAVSCFPRSVGLPMHFKL